ncbi:hypothetical protein ABZP36_024558 [Zizania latifolia]
MLPSADGPETVPFDSKDDGAPAWGFLDGIMRCWARLGGSESGCCLESLPNQSGLVAKQKELKINSDPPPSSRQPPNDKKNDQNDKGKKQLEDLSEDNFSDDSGKVDIPDYIDDQSEEECVHSLDKLSEPLDKALSLAIVPFNANEYVEMLIASDHLESQISKSHEEVNVQKDEPRVASINTVAKPPKAGKKKRGPPIAQRKSARIKRDGVSIALKA